MSQLFSRRQFFKKYVYAGFTVFGIVFTSCQPKAKNVESSVTDDSPASCNDLSGLTQEEIKVRETFGYVDESPLADNQCDNCNLWLPSENNEVCGRCLLFKGPVFAAGHCTSWAPTTED